MSLLTDEEMTELVTANLEAGGGYHQLGHAVQAAFLAKLASAELPEPAGKLRSDEFDGHVFEPSLDWPFGDLYTADHLRQAYVQGAAAQLSAEPSGFLDRYGEIFAEVEQMLSTDTPLYTRRQA